MTAKFLPAVIGDDAPQNVGIRGNQVVATVNIAAGASLSEAIDLGRYRLLGIILPSGWATAGLTFQAATADSATDAGYLELTDDAGVAVPVTGTAGVFIALKTATQALFAMVRFLKVRSGTSGSPVVQSVNAITAIKLVLEPSP